MFESVEAPRSAWSDWILRGAVGLALILIGAAKFSSDPRSEWVKLFDQIGLANGSDTSLAGSKPWVAC
jgi:hypothetical protein